MSHPKSKDGYSIYDLLMMAPEHQVKRLQIAYRAIAAGQWPDAVFSLRNAIQEELERMHPQLMPSGRYWHCELRELVDQIEATYCPAAKLD